MRFRNAIIGLLFLALAGAAFLVRNLDSSRPKRLLDHATRVNAHRGWQNFAGKYCWLSDQEALAFFPESDTHYTAVRLNIATGAAEPLNALAERVHRAGVIPVGVFHFQPSPDGRWLAWSAESGGYLARLDGTGLVRWNSEPAESFSLFGLFWEADGRRWLVLARDPNAAATARWIPYHADLSAQPVKITRQKPLSVAAAIGAFNLRNGHAALIGSYLISYHWGQGITRTVVRQDVPVGTGQSVMIRLPVTMPREGMVHSVLISSRGEKIAWLIGSQTHPSPALRWLSRLLPFIKAQPRPLLSVYVSGPYGSQPALIGVMETNAHQPDKTTPTDFQWLPGQKRLSFIYQGGLYTVPVESPFANGQGTLGYNRSGDNE